MIIYSKAEKGFVTIQINTALKLMIIYSKAEKGFVTIQINTALKRKS